jgi:asparagine synthase (glutamine-hydrolysing)
MSVQAGIFRFDGAPATSDWLLQASSYLREYGPDGEHTHIEASLRMLYRPHHTTANSHCEPQPLILADGSALMWDGRLDNRDELIRSMSLSLGGDSSDAAIAAQSFQFCGTECFRHFVGDWAVSIYDPRHRTIILARDYIGVKQLFYYLKEDTLRWCSHLSGLADCGDVFEVCDEYIAGYLAFKPDSRLTPYAEIRAVPPGGFVLVRNSHATEYKFWSFDPWRKTRHKTVAEYQDRYLHLLRQSLRRRLRANGPVLCSLSGGLDSSSIACLADELRLKGETRTRLDTVSYYDRSEPEEDDSYYLALVEQQRRRRGFHIDLMRPEDCLPFEYSGFRPTPGFAMRSEVTTSMADIIARGRYRVLLSGTGGDEMNAQALSISVAMADLLARFQLRRASSELLAWSYLTRRPLLQLFLTTLLELMPLDVRARFAERGELQPWIDKSLARKYRIRARQLETLPGIWFWRPGPRDAAQTLMTLSNDLTFSSPSTIEVRYPYLDQDLVEFLTSIPFEQLLRPGNRRFLMRNALSGIVPNEILERRTKVSAMRCYSLALQKHWNEIERVLDRPFCAALHYVDAKKLKADLQMVRNGHCPIYLVRLLKALSLELWLRDVVSRGIISEPDPKLPRGAHTVFDASIGQKELVATKN